MKKPPLLRPKLKQKQKQTPPTPPKIEGKTADLYKKTNIAIILDRHQNVNEEY